MPERDIIVIQECLVDISILHGRTGSAYQGTTIAAMFSGITLDELQIIDRDKIGTAANGKSVMYIGQYQGHCHIFGLPKFESMEGFLVLVYWNDTLSE